MEQVLGMRTGEKDGGPAYARRPDSKTLCRLWLFSNCTNAETERKVPKEPGDQRQGNEPRDDERVDQ